MEIKINFLSQLKALTDLIVMSIIYSFVILCTSIDDLKLMFFLLIPYFLMFFLPTVFLHCNYLMENNGIVFEITKKAIIKKVKNNILECTIDDICEIIIYTGGTRGTVAPGLAHSNYYYVKINFLDGSSFVITSLCSSKIDKILKDNFPNVKTTTEKVFYPMIS
ncbi:hypothetical protein JI750_05870 [Flavobacterium sp. GN10]|uniref:PH domain-containing protein n=1 Tax=Flavobacterium tagetis TaxID=2801336 RepID=A0ABS1KAQ3_9FLAO|nr:hypothetical protein [Flavobacterium tagetis]MBL0736403.1 hypothetical protein [Flavobacterium tagetis]